MLISINPSTGDTIKVYKPFSFDEVQATIESCHDAFLRWRRTGFDHRAIRMREAARVLRKKEHHFAEVMALEMGKPLREGVAEALKCAWVCEYYADNAETMLSPEDITTEALKSYISFQPLGVVLAVMPWNFPFWQVFRFAAPALMAGNGAILKHSSNVCGLALLIEGIFQEAGFPENLFRTLLVGSRDVEPVIEHPLVRAVTLTGSTPAGQAVAARAGAMLKKTVLELGGSDPYVILADAHLQETVTACVTSRLMNSGQSCIAAKRFIVVPEIREQFESMFVEKMKEVRYGDPLQSDAGIGPLARADLRDDVHAQVVESIHKGAVCLLGGEVPEGPGAFYPPTVLTDVRPGMPAYDDELFGPVAAVIAAPDEKAAIDIANDSAFGLGAAVFTADREKGERIARDEFQAGGCFVNDFVRSDPRLPFGGIKNSGYGRELSAYGIKEFVNIKTVYVK
jgi:succinate-semialdehyde dehydrogenase/glutarate-semialdehyde dehydrogenase